MERTRRRPSVFEIGSIATQEIEQSGTVRVGGTRAVPSRFWATIEMVRPQLTVTLRIQTTASAWPVVTSLTVETDLDTPITTPVLRRVLVDRLVAAAVTAASKTVTAVEIDDVAGSAFATNDGQIWVGPPSRPRTGRARDATRYDIEMTAWWYEQALMLGNPAPAKYAAEKMGKLSRSTIARYLRRARAEGILAERS